MFKYRHRVLILLFFLSIITYLDRVCILIVSEVSASCLNMLMIKI